MLRWLFLAQALVNVLFAIPLIFATGTMLSMYGLTTDRVGTYIAQFLGAVFIILAWNGWFARNWPDGEPRRMLVRGAFLGTLFGFAVSLNFQLGPAANTSTWVFVALTAIFSVGWGYYAIETMRRPVTRELTA